MNNNLLKIRFSAAFLFLIYTIIVKVLDAEAADTLLTVALVFSVSCLAVALYEVVTSHRIHRAKKALWVAGLLLFNWPAMLYYVFIARKNIRNQPQSELHVTTTR